MQANPLTVVVVALVAYLLYEYFKNRKKGACGEFGCCGSIHKCRADLVMKDKEGSNCVACEDVVQATTSTLRDLGKGVESAPAFRAARQATSSERAHSDRLLLSVPANRRTKLHIKQPHQSTPSLGCIKDLETVQFA